MHGPLAAVGGDDAAALRRHGPFAALVALSLASLALPGVQATSGGLVALAAAAVLLAAVLGAVARGRGARPLGPLLPALQLLACGLLRQGTGGPESPFEVLVLLPAVLAAADHGRRGVALGTVGAAAVVLVPDAVAGRLPAPAVVHAVVLAVVVLLVAVTVHLLADRMRARARELADLRATEARLQAGTQQAAAEVAARTEEVQRARDLFASVIDAATEQSIIGTDTRGVVDLFNRGAERLLGWARHEVVGRRRITDLHAVEELAARREEIVSAHPGAADVGVFGALVGAAFTGGSDVRDWTYVRSDGSAVVVRVAVTPRVDADGRTSGYIFVATDMSAEREAARLKDEFVSLISHELRTPLSSILGYLELTAEEGDLTPEQRQYLGVVERNANRLLRLVGDLLFTAQVEAGRFTLVRHAVDLSGLVLAAVETARPAADAAGVVLSATGTAAPAIAHVDPVRLGQALDNLVSNGLKFTPRGGRVVVDLSVRDPGPTATIAVSDTGIGIAAAELDQLFSRFFRASTATRAAVPGVGLGLTITQAILTAHGGTLSVRSTVGEGTTFLATLPMGADAADAPPGT